MAGSAAGALVRPDHLRYARRVCGIAGWLGEVADGDRLSATLAGALRHRGPDAEGRRRWPCAGFVHTRLSIIDLTPTGNQPIGEESGRIWAIFNGEIYNHHALRAGLEARGHRFRGRADSEVLPHLYRDAGADMLPALRGMFALAIYDEQRRTLLLARDRFGIKPLFYARLPGGIAFASEVRALRAVPGVDLTVDRQAAADFAALSYVPAPLTMFRGIRCLEPGQALEARWHDGTVEWSLRRFHTFRLAVDPTLDVETATGRARELLERAVRSQLESDVPLGCLLSGGIDSSLVSAAAQKALTQPLRTYNVQMPDPQYDETWAAQAVASHIGSQHHTLRMESAGGAWDGIVSLLGHCGQPFADSSLFAVHEVCRAMRREVTVALSGDGGDEGFAGYYFYWAAERVAGWLRWPAPVLRAGTAVAAVARRLGFVSPSFPYNLSRYAGDTDAAIVQSLTEWIDRRQHGLLVRDGGLEDVGRHYVPQWEHDLGPAADRGDRLWALATEYNVRLLLPNDFLFKTDIASMRVGLELRVPLLDEDLMEFALSLPRDLKIRGHEGKQTLRSLASQALPNTVATKPKMGFGVPVDSWVDDAFRARLRSLLLGPASVLPGLYDPAVYAPWIEAFAARRPHPDANREGLYYRAIMLLALQVNLAPASAAP
jgi:asparagine synthase (glutamine-hydrolysing)